MDFHIRPRREVWRFRLAEASGQKSHTLQKETTIVPNCLIPPAMKVTGMPDYSGNALFVIADALSNRNGREAHRLSNRRSGNLGQQSAVGSTFIG
jgi:hypothetical protein